MGGRTWGFEPGKPMRPAHDQIRQAVMAGQGRRRAASDPGDGRRNNKFPKNNITMQVDAEDEDEQGMAVSADDAEGDDAAPSRAYVGRVTAVNLAWLRLRDSHAAAVRFYETVLANSDLETLKSHIAALTIERCRLAAHSKCCSDGCPCGHKQPPVEKRDEAGERMDLWTVLGCRTVELPVMACSSPECGRVMVVEPVSMGFIPKTPTQPNAWFHVQILETAAELRLKGLSATGMLAWVSFALLFRLPRCRSWLQRPVPHSVYLALNPTYFAYAGVCAALNAAWSERGGDTKLEPRDVEAALHQYTVLSLRIFCPRDLHLDGIRVPGDAFADCPACAQVPERPEAHPG